MQNYRVTEPTQFKKRQFNKLPFLSYSSFVPHGPFKAEMLLRSLIGGFVVL